MITLGIDLETFSSMDLVKAGVYAYTSAPDFEILLFAYAYDEEEVRLIDLASGEKIPDQVLRDLEESKVTKVAFNAQFERTCLSKYLNQQISPDSWQCTAVQSAILGLPLSLEGVGQVLGLEQQKLREGKDLIRYFAIPCKPTQTNGYRTRNLPHHAPEKWERFKVYCQRDVEVERAIRRKIVKYPIPEKEQKLYILDQQINDCGVQVDRDLVTQAITCDTLYQRETFFEAQCLTGLENPNSVAQLKEWLLDNGVEVDSLTKKAVEDLAKESDGEVERLLSLRQQMAKTSIKKYEAMKRAVCPDGRVRGTLQFYGANRTGRWAGRIINVQNLPQNHLPDLTLARNLLKAGCFDELELLFESVPKVLSELIRTAFIPRQGHRFIVADFSAIEARVIAWLAGEKWRMDVFATHGKIYEASASQMFKVPLEEITKGSPLRQKGKVAELACIAEGSLVLTDDGLIPIEKVKLRQRLWDGENWVNHDGVIFKGKKEVIEYEGLRATKDHLVWVQGQSGPISFGYAATSGAHLLQTGNGRQAIRMGQNNQFRKEMEQKYEPLLCFDAVCKLSKCSLDSAEQFDRRNIKRVPTMLSTEASTKVVRKTVNSCKTTMRKSQRPKLPQIWRQRYQVSICHGFRCRAMDYGKRKECFEELGIGSYRLKQSLQAGEYKICDEKSKPRKQNFNNTIKLESNGVALFKSRSKKNALIRTDKRRDHCQSSPGSERKTEELEIDSGKARVYDICNVGRNNRFTVSNYLVHNCGYGGGAGALKAMGALDMGVLEEELAMLIKNWRAANPNITRFWWNINRAALKSIKDKAPQTVGQIQLECTSGILFITLPSGRRLSYIKPRLEKNKFGRDGITYEGIGESKRWCRIDTYGPKLVENIVQATARDLLAEAMLSVDRASYKIVMHVHDEVVIEAPNGIGSTEEVCSIMSIPPDWADGLPLRADGYECQYYRKD